MANGKPGDHPITDIVNYDLPIYTPEIDDLVRELQGRGALNNGFASVWLMDKQRELELFHASGDRDGEEGVIRALTNVLIGERSRLERDSG